MRIVSICPSNTEILYFLGLEEQVVGVDDYSDWPIEWSTKPRLGPDLNINIEKVKSLQPDMVIASLSVPGMEKNIEQLKSENIPYIILNAKSIWEIADDILECGFTLGLTEKAKEVANQYLDELNRIKNKVPNRLNPPRLYWEWWPKPVFTPGKKNWLTDVSRLVGAMNIYEDIHQESVQTDWEDVAKLNPDYTLIVWTGIDKHRIRKELITSRLPWKGKKLGQEEQIHILEEGWYCRPSPRLLTGIQHLAYVLYPDQFDTPNPDQPLTQNIR